MKVIGICGSARKRGNTDLLLEEALKGARSKGASTEKIFLNDLDIKPCQDCGHSAEACTCNIPDDMQLIYKKIDEADRLIIASPIYFGSVSAQTKIMIDRFQPYWIARYVLKKPIGFKKGRKGIFFSTSGSGRMDFFKNAREVVRNFFATIAVRYAGELYIGNIDKRGEIKKRSAILKKAFLMGCRLVKG